MQMVTNKLGRSFLVVLGVIALVTTTHTQAAASAESGKSVNIAPVSAPADILDGITFAGEYTDADVTYLRNSLQLLQNQLPAWSQYIEEAKPLVLAIDLNEGEHGRLAVAQCCGAGGSGVLRFGFHFGQSVDDAEQTPEAKQAAFLGTLTHEVTHIRDQRAGRFTTKTDRKSCVAAEKSGLEKQLEVKHAMAAENLGDAFAQALGQQIASDTRALKSRELWDRYCGAFED